MKHDIKKVYWEMNKIGNELKLKIIYIYTINE